MPSLFTKIIEKEIPADILHEDDICLVFRDIAPQAPTHFLVIPKKEIVSLAELTPEDQPIVGHCLLIASEVAAKEGLQEGIAWSQIHVITAAKKSLTCISTSWEDEK